MDHTLVALRVALVATTLAFTAATPAAEPLSLESALRRAARTHPDLQGFAAEREGQVSQRSLAHRAPAPEVGLLLEDAAGTGERSGPDSAQWTLSYVQALELGDQRAARAGLADAREAGLLAQQRERTRDALAEVTQRFIEAAADAERLRLAEQQVELARETLDAAQRRVDAARAPLAEAARARAALARAVLQREHAEHEEQSARVALAVGLGIAEPDFGELRADLFRLPPMRPLGELRASLQNSPAMQARLAQAAIHDAERRAALAAGDLRPTLTGGVRRHGQGDDLSIVAGVAIALGAPSRARDEAGFAAARLAQSQAESRGALLRAEEALFDRYQELRHAREAMRQLDQEVLPSYQEALKHTRHAYDRGRYGFLELSQALTELAAARRERLDTAARYHELLADLERLTGENLIDRSAP